MKTITEAMVASALNNGSATVETVQVVTPLQREFYSGVNVEACLYDGGDFGINLSRPVRFASAQEAEAFQDALVALICRHTGGTVKAE